MSRCRHCQHENPAGARFCGECGAAIEVSCPACGGANPPGSKFCNHCGTRLAAAPTAQPVAQPVVQPTPQLEGERRKVTILFADLSGSTALGEKFDAEDVYEVMNACFTGLTAIIDRHEGYVLKFIGDCIMALFGAPVAHGDDPQRAVRAALEMQEWLTGFSRDLEQRKGVPFRMRIGLNFGNVIAGGVGSDLKMEYDVLGDSVNVAQRLEATAEPGTVYISESVQRLTQRQFRHEYVGPIQVKGRAEPVGVYRVVEPLEAPDEAGVELETAMVGREAQWNILAARLDKLASGAGHWISINGEPGIGKTRMLEEALEYSGTHGIATRLIRCTERHAHTPFALFRTFLLQVCGLNETDNVARSTPKLQTTLTELDPALQEWLPYLAHLVEPGVAVQPGLDEQTRKQLTVRGLCEVVWSHCKAHPFVLAIDDAQWMDELSAEVVMALRNSVNSRPLLILIGHRPATHDYLQSAGLLPEYSDELALDALEADQCLQLIGAFVDPAKLPAALLQTIIDRCGGNPFFLMEIMRHLIDSGQLQLDSDGRGASAPAESIELPDSVYSVVLARLDRVDAASKSVLQSGAVIGQEFAVWLLQTLLDAPPGLTETLKQLVSAEFLRQQAAPPQQEFRFKHTAVREVAYGTLLLQQRRDIHRRIAQLLEEFYIERLSDVASLLAHHYRVAEVWPRALEYLVLAGDDARDLFANTDAIRFYREGLQLLEHMESPLDRELGRSSFHELRAREGLGDVYERLAEYSEAIAEYERALACLGSCRLAITEHALRTAGIRRRMAKCLFETGAQAQADDLLRAAFSALRGQHTAEFDRERSLIVCELGFGRYRAGRYRDAERFGRWAYRLAQAASAELEMGDASNLRGLACQARGQSEGAINYYRSTLNIAERTGNLAAIGTVLNNLGTVHYRRGEFAEADACYERAQQLWLKIGDVAQLATMHNNIGNLHLGRGNYAQAVESFQTAIGLFHQAHNLYGEAASLAVLGEVQLERGETEAAVRALEEAQALAKPLETPDLLAYILTVLAQAEIERGDLHNSEAHCREALLIAREIGAAPFEGICHRTLGKIARLRQEYSTAAQALHRAYSLFKDNGLQHDLGRTLMEQAILSRVRGDDAEARKRLREAIELFEKLGADGDLTRAETLLSSYTPD